MDPGKEALPGHHILFFDLAEPSRARQSTWYGVFRISYSAICGPFTLVTRVFLGPFGLRRTPNRNLRGQHTFRLHFEVSKSHVGVPPVLNAVCRYSSKREFARLSQKRHTVSVPFFQPEFCRPLQTLKAPVQRPPHLSYLAFVFLCSCALCLARSISASQQVSRNDQRSRNKVGE